MRMQTMMQTLKMNMTTTRRSQANETSQHIMTCHVRHIFTPVHETNKK